MDWKEAAVPPVLSAANEKGLNADRSALAGHGKDVCISQALRVDRLTALNESQRFPAVAVNRGQLEIHRVRFALPRSEERRVGHTCVSTCRFRGSQYH